MEQLNRVELRGNVGSVRTQSSGGKKVSRITLATNHAYKDKNGNPVIETTWHNVVAWEGKGICDLDSLERGCGLYACGRIHCQKFVGQDEVERTSYEILASKLVRIDNDEPLQCEF